MDAEIVVGWLDFVKGYMWGSEMKEGRKKMIQEALDIAKEAVRSQYG